MTRRRRKPPPVETLFDAWPASPWHDEENVTVAYEIIDTAIRVYQSEAPPEELQRLVWRVVQDFDIEPVILTLAMIEAAVLERWSLDTTGTENAPAVRDLLAHYRKFTSALPPTTEGDQP